MAYRLNLLLRYNRISHALGNAGGRRGDGKNRRKGDARRKPAKHPYQGSILESVGRQEGCGCEEYPPEQCADPSRDRQGGQKDPSQAGPTLLAKMRCIPDDAVVETQRGDQVAQLEKRPANRIKTKGSRTQGTR